MVTRGRSKMTPRWRVSLAFILCLTLVLLCFANDVSAQDEEQIPTSLETPAALTTHDQEQVMLDDGKQEQLRELPGHAQYHEAANILNRLKVPRRRLARYHKPTSLLASVGHYVKQAFRFLFMNGPKQDVRSPRTPSQSLLRAIALLEEAAHQDNKDAMFTLAEMNMHALFSHQRNFTEAIRWYQDLSSTFGNASAQHMIGFAYATGIGNVLEKDQARALLYHSYAADGGDIRSQMTLAHRYHTGIAAPRDCERSVLYYRQVAEEAMAWKHTGPPGGQALLTEAQRLADEDGGVYGEGASVSSSGQNAKNHGPSHDANAAFDDVLEYLDLMSRKGELRAIFNLGRLHYDGSRALEQNYRIAADKFFDVARRYWDKSGKIRPDTEAGVDKLASRAAGYLGRMFLRGEGLEQNFQIAKVWFQRGIQNGDALAQYSMGMMHLEGLGMPKNPVRAAEFFGAAADENFAAAQVRLGALLMDQGDLAAAIKYFELAARQEHIEAFYYLAELANQGVGGGSRNCNQAALYYKKVAEKAEQIHSNFGEANDAFEEGDYETALLLNMMAAEQGYEIAQSNVAYLLDRFVVQPASQLSYIISKVFPLAWLSNNVHLPFVSLGRRSPTKLFGDAALALVYWTRSARGGNIDSLVKLGDYYLAGIGVPRQPLAVLKDDAGKSTAKRNNTKVNENHSKAAACYSAASETLQSSQALFNLGWMHENGIGLEQDFHLAKRYYDAAAEPPMREAKVPVAIALAKLRVRGWWDWITGGHIKQIDDMTDEPAEKNPKQPKTFWQWFQEFLAADLQKYEEEEEAARRNGESSGHVNEWGEGLRPDYEGDDWEDFGDSVIETFVIIGLAGALAFLVFYRQMANLRERARQQREQQRQAIAQQPEGPLSPYLDDMARANQASAQGTGPHSGSQSTTPSAISQPEQQVPAAQPATSAPVLSSSQQQPIVVDTTAPESSPAQAPRPSDGEGNGWSFVDLPQDQQSTSRPPDHDPAGPGAGWASGPGGIGH